MEPGTVQVFSNKKRMLALLGLFALLGMTASTAMVCGSYDISMAGVVQTVWHHLHPGLDPSNLGRFQDTIVWKIRLPRVLMATGVGAALATAGAVFQGCFRNPLVDPYILGVSSGAAFGAGLGIVFPGFFLSVQSFAFIFGVTAVIVSYLLARIGDEVPLVTLILSGVIVDSLFSALVGVLKYLATDSTLRTIVFWIMGGFYHSSWADVRLVVPIVILSFLVIWSQGWKLNVLSMGDEEARALGLDPGLHKTLLITLATLITAVSVSSVGVIAWVGLMMPHATRMLIGTDNRFLIPAAALLGAVYMIVCDTLARTLVSAEIPVTIITSILGAPYLFYLIKTRGRALAGV